ncbi:MAG: 5'/3'-nucleotidase SurE [Geminicoccaceae bacterium]
MTDKPRILLTNDDGIHAPGLRSLERIARELSDDVWIVAPERNNSGAGHSLTLRRPLRIRRVAERQFAVDGTPTDCVLLALQHIMRDEPVDLVLSGVNHGGNLAEDFTYSGTIAAAMEATLFKVRAVAMSQVLTLGQPVHWATAERFGPDIVRRLLTMPWTEDMLVNVNYPDRAPEAVRGVKVTAQGKRKLGDDLVERMDPRGEPYIWIGALREDPLHREGTDLAAVNDGYVSVTPIHMDMTHRESFAGLTAVLGG